MVLLTLDPGSPASRLPPPPSAAAQVKHKANELYLGFFSTTEAQQLCRTLVTRLHKEPEAMAEAGDASPPPQEVSPPPPATPPPSGSPPAAAWGGGGGSPSSDRSSPMDEDGSPPAPPPPLAPLPPSPTHKRSIESCSPTPPAASAAAAPAAAAGSHSGEHSAKRVATTMARLPMSASLPPLIPPRAASSAHEARAQEAALANLLAAMGAGSDGARLSLDHLAELLPQLPGGGLPTSLCRALWRRLATPLSAPQLPGSPTGGGQRAATAGGLKAFFARRLAGVPAEARLLPCLAAADDGAAVGAAELLDVTEAVAERHPSLAFLRDSPGFLQR